MYKIYRFLLNFPNNFKHFIKNLWYFKTFLWVYRDFSWEYIIMGLRDILKKQTEFYYSDKTVCVNAKKRGKEIMKARIVLDRILDDYVSNNAHEQLDKKWGKIIFSDDFNNDFKRSNVITEKDEIEFKKDFANYLNDIAYRQKQEFNYLFNLLKKKLKDWWD